MACVRTVLTQRSYQLRAPGLLVQKVTAGVLSRRERNKLKKKWKEMAKNRRWRKKGIGRPENFLFVFGVTAPVGQGLLIHEVCRSHTTTHHSR